tara:strand:+ start:325 stop:756 length:432 start_codon:yes stop_codon:yes gene_type:complete
MIKYFDIFLIALITNILFFYIYHTNNLNNYDKYNIFTVFIINLFLFVFLFLKHDLAIDLIHIFISLNIFLFSFFVKNIKIILVYIGIIITILSYWEIYGKCPMGRYDNLTRFKNFSKKLDDFYIYAPYIVLGILFFKVYLHYN